MDFDPTSLQNEIKELKTAIFGSPFIKIPYPPQTDELDNIRERLRNLENVTVSNFQIEFNTLKSVIFGGSTITGNYPQWDDNLDSMRNRLRHIESMVISGGDPLIVVKGKVDQLCSDHTWISSMVLRHQTTLDKFENVDMESMKEIATHLKSIVENLNNIIDDPRFQNELVRMDELIKRIDNSMT